MLEHHQDAHCQFISLMVVTARDSTIRDASIFFPLDLFKFSKPFIPSCPFLTHVSPHIGEETLMSSNNSLKIYQ